MGASCTREETCGRLLIVVCTRCAMWQAEKNSYHLFFRPKEVNTELRPYRTNVAKIMVIKDLLIL